MEANKFLTADFLDILFEGRNKDYGAYQLRKTYNKRIAIAITSMGFTCLLFFLSQILANDNKEKGTVLVKDVSLINVKPDEPIKPEPPVVKPPKVEPQKVETIRWTQPVIVDDNEVEEPLPEAEKLEDTRIGLKDQDGVREDDFIAPPVETNGIGPVEVPKNEVEDYDGIFHKVEKEAKFPGGMEGWKRYLQRNLNANAAADEGAPAGSYTVKVQFIVDKEGGISDVQAIEVPKACPGCGQEAIKVIKKGPKWEPAIQNGRKVVYQAVQFITFQVAEE